MIDRLLKVVLGWTGRRDLVPFVEGIAHAGRPSSVAFPAELVGQGLALAVSGLNNTTAFQGHAGWVWPYWYTRQSDPTLSGFVPTGMNVLTQNVTLRNWTSLGAPGSSHECMVDPVGMLTLHAFGPSVFPYVRLEGEDWFPPQLGQSTEQSLEGGFWPCVITCYRVAERLEWSSETMVVTIDDEELVSFRHRLANTGRDPVDLTFGLAVRPYNPLTVGHINKIKFKDGLWRVNRLAQLWLLDPPDRAVAATRQEGDPLRSLPGLPDHVGCSSRSGIATGLSEYRVHLAPGEHRWFESVGTLHKAGGSRFWRRTPADLERARSDAHADWRQRAERGVQVRLGDARLERAFRAVKNRLHAFDDGTHFSPGTFLYHEPWIRDAAFLALAHETLGLGDAVDAKIDPLLARQERDGFFKSQDGEWDSQGQALCILMDRVRFSGDLLLGKRIWPAVLKAVRWLEKQLARTRSQDAPHRGLLPAGFSAEHFGPNDHYFWDDFWALAGLREAAWLGERLGAKVESIHELLEQLDDDLAVAVARAAERCGGVLPSSPYRDPDSACIGNLVGVSPLGVVPAAAAWVWPTADFLFRRGTMEGLLFQGIVHTGLNAYLSVQLARVLLALSDPRWRVVLDGLLDAASPTWAWPEAIHPRTGGGCMGDGDHGWAAAEFLLLVVELLVSVRGDELHLGPGVPPEWWDGRGGFAVDGVVTRHGTVSWSVEHEEGDFVLRWKVTRNPLQERVRTWMHVPLTGGGPARVIEIKDDEGVTRIEHTHRRRGATDG